MSKQISLMILKVTGPLLIFFGIVSFTYVMYGSNVHPKDTLITVFFIAGGIYFTKLGYKKHK